MDARESRNIPQRSSAVNIPFAHKLIHGPGTKQAEDNAWEEKWLQLLLKILETIEVGTVPIKIVQMVFEVCKDEMAEAERTFPKLQSLGPQETIERSLGIANVKLDIHKVKRLLPKVRKTLEGLWEEAGEEGYAEFVGMAETGVSGWMGEFR
ncbi:hypothetical protein ACLMJK_007701 [Lecanora helva]